MRCKWPICVTVPNLIKIGQTVAEIRRFNGFFIMAAVRHLGFAGRRLGPPATTSWWFLSLCKIWLKSMQYSFDNTKLSIFCPFGLKTPIHAPENWGFRRISPPKWGAVSTKPPKGTSLRESASFEPSSVKIRRRVWPVGEFMKKGINKF